MSLPDNCPRCDSSMVGDEIPAASRHYYAPTANHYMRWLARTDIDLDRTVSYLCPDCGTEFEAKEFRRE